MDDTPYGGGAGMVIRVDVVEAALEARYGRGAVEVRRDRRVIALAAGGRQFDDALATSSPREQASRSCAAATRASTSACTSTSPPTCLDRPVRAGGRRAGGDGGVRRRDAEAAGRAGPRGQRASRSRSATALEGAPEYPHYTRPADWRGPSVPEVLLSGDHGRIREWRLEQSRGRARSSGRAPARFATIRRRATARAFVPARRRLLYP